MSAPGHRPLLRARGMGGHIDAYADRVEIYRHGLVHLALEALLLHEGSTELVLPIDCITSVALVEPLFYPAYIRFFYAGAPQYSKDYWTDAATPSTLLMGYFDHRAFHRLRDFIVTAQAAMRAA